LPGGNDIILRKDLFGHALFIEDFCGIDPDFDLTSNNMGDAAGVLPALSRSRPFLRHVAYSAPALRSPRCRRSATWSRCHCMVRALIF